ncbi:MAG: SRPBCC domain-containing protein [Capsulimonadaceae bacterium]|nr:SRPBCC domain-containing protein [Capsulimonadaceae bacterium]
MTETEIIDENKLVMRRRYAASPERLFEAWTKPSLLQHWFMPNERWAWTKADIDLRVGGRYRIVMRHSDGDEFIVGGAYRVVDAPSKLSFTFSWEKNPMDNQRHDTIVTLDFATVDGGTELTLTHERFAAKQDAEQHSQGWGGMLDMLQKYVDA